MKKSNKSPKGNKDKSILDLTDKQKAEKVLKLAHEQQRDKENNPNLTAVIVREDKKLSRLHWIKSDELNNKIL